MRGYLQMAWIAIATALAWHPAAAHSPSDTASAKPGTTAHWIGETGTASYYGPAHQGRRTASGSRFDEYALTAAHPWLPFGTLVRVTLAGSGRSVVVMITDRLYSHRRIVDLSLAAARQLGIVHQGLAQVSLTPA
ncbi:MAG TPA: septal ring lytic transglycosylase RlpA family protein [Acetobacteraceae bacterium]|jgi:rare lipoprotein A